MTEVELIDTLLDKPVELDKTDRKILYELMIDGRQPLSQIGTKVHESEQVVAYRINRMQEKGVISEFLTVLEISKLDLGVYRAFFRLANVDSEKEKEIIQHFKDQPHVFWLVRTGGRWDLLIDYITDNIAEFDAELQKSMNKYQQHLQNKEVVAFIDSHHYRRNYLHPDKKHDDRRVYFGGVPQQEEFDRTDLNILKTIATNARMPLIDISRKLDISTNTVRRRINKMEDNGIIQGYSALPHPTVFGCPCYKILLTVHNINDTKEQKLLEFGKSHENIIFLEKVVGSWDFEYDVECNSDKEFRTLMRTMKDELSDIVVDYETITFYYDYKVNYFPMEPDSVLE